MQPAILVPIPKSPSLPPVFSKPKEETVSTPPPASKYNNLIPSERLLSFFIEQGFVDPQSGLLSPRFCSQTLNTIRTSTAFKQTVKAFIFNTKHVVTDGGSLNIEYTLHQRFSRECQYMNKNVVGCSFYICGDMVNYLVGAQLWKETFVDIFGKEIFTKDPNDWDKLFTSFCQKPFQSLVCTYNVISQSEAPSYAYVPGYALGSLVEYENPERAPQYVQQIEETCLRNKTYNIKDKFLCINYHENETPVQWRTYHCEPKFNGLAIQITYKNENEIEVEFAPHINEVQLSFSNLFNWPTIQPDLFKIFYDTTFRGASRFSYERMGKLWLSFITSCKVQNGLSQYKFNLDVYIYKHIIEVFETKCCYEATQLLAMTFNVSLSIRDHFKDHEHVNSSLWKSIFAYLNTKQNDPFFDPTNNTGIDDPSRINDWLALNELGCIILASTTQNPIHPQSLQALVLTSDTDRTFQLSWKNGENTLYLSFSRDSNKICDQFFKILHKWDPEFHCPILLDILVSNPDCDQKIPQQINQTTSFTQETLSLLSGFDRSKYLGFVLASILDNHDPLVEKRILLILPEIIFFANTHDDSENCMAHLNQYFRQHALGHIMKEKKNFCRIHDKFNEEDLATLRFSFISDYLDIISSSTEFFANLCFEFINTRYITLEDPFESEKHKTAFILHIPQVLKNLLLRSPYITRNLVYALTECVHLPFGFRLLILVAYTEQLSIQKKQKQLKLTGSIKHLHDMFKEKNVEIFDEKYISLENMPQLLAVIKKAEDSEKKELLQIFMSHFDKLKDHVKNALDKQTFYWPLCNLLFATKDAAMVARAKEIMKKLFNEHSFPDINLSLSLLSSAEKIQYQPDVTTTILVTKMDIQRHNTHVEQATTASISTEDHLRLITYLLHEPPQAYIIWKHLVTPFETKHDLSYKEISIKLIDKLCASHYFVKAFTVIGLKHFQSQFTSDHYANLLMDYLTKSLEYIRNIKNVNISHFNPLFDTILQNIDHITNHKKKIEFYENALDALLCAIEKNKKQTQVLILHLDKIEHTYLYEKCPIDQCITYFKTLAVFAEKIVEVEDRPVFYLHMCKMFTQERINKHFKELLGCLLMLFSLNFDFRVHKTLLLDVVTYLSENHVIIIVNNLMNTGFSTFSSILFLLLNTQKIKSLDALKSACDYISKINLQIKERNEWNDHFETLTTESNKVLMHIYTLFTDNYLSAEIFGIHTNRKTRNSVKELMLQIMTMYFFQFEFYLSLISDPVIQSHQEYHLSLTSRCLYILGHAEISKKQFPTIDVKINELIPNIFINDLTVQVVFLMCIQGIKRIETNNIKSVDLYLCGMEDRQYFFRIMFGFISRAGVSAERILIMKNSLKAIYKQTSYTPTPDLFLKSIENQEAKLRAAATSGN